MSAKPNPSPHPPGMPQVQAYPASGYLEGSIFIEAKPEVVFQALTDPKELAAWWGSPELYRTHSWHMDLRPGGQWGCEVEGGSSGKPQSVSGTILGLNPPHWLEYTWRPSWENFQETTIRYELNATDDGTLLRFRHTGFQSQDSCEAHQAGWIRVMGWLWKAASTRGRVD